MIKSITTVYVYVNCDKCGFGVIVGDGENANIDFDASDAMTAEEAGWMTLTEHHGWTYDDDTEEILCPDCSHS